MKLYIDDIEVFDEIQVYDKKQDKIINIAESFPKSSFFSPSFWKYEATRKSDVGGSMPKVFVRCNSNVLEDLFEAQKDPNCSYVTYFDDAITENRGESPLSKIGVMLKGVHYKGGNHKEETASYFANVLRVPTVYNKAVTMGENELILSVDFLKENEEFLPFFGHVFIEDFPNAISSINENINKLIGKDKVSKENRARLIEDFINIYLFRQYIIGDGDFVLENIGLIHNTKDNTYKWAPCFDLELTFHSAFISEKNKLNDLKSIHNLYPDRLKEIMKGYYSALRTKKITKGTYAGNTVYENIDKTLRTYLHSLNINEQDAFLSEINNTPNM